MKNCKKFNPFFTFLELKNLNFTKIWGYTSECIIVGGAADSPPTHFTIFCWLTHAQVNPSWTRRENREEGTKTAKGTPKPTKESASHQKGKRRIRQEEVDLLDGSLTAICAVEYRSIESHPYSIFFVNLTLFRCRFGYNSSCPCQTCISSFF